MRSAPYLYNPDEQAATAGAAAPTNVLQAEVLAPNLGALLAELESMRRKAEKLGLPEITWTVSEGVEKILPAQAEETDWDRFEVGPLHTFMHVVTVVGQPPRINGWRLIGVITPMEHGNFLTAVPGADARSLEPYRAATLVCHHCGLERRRNETLVIQHDDGRTMQVGKDCAHDFLGRKGVDELLKWAEWDHRLAQLMAMAGEDGGFGSSTREKALGLEYFLATVWVVIKAKGWVPSSKAKEEGLTPTWSHTLMLIKQAKDDRTTPFTPEDLAYTTSAVQEARARFEAKAREGTLESGYQTNLLAILRNGYVVDRSVGLAASIYAHLDRVHEEESRARRMADLAARGLQAGYFGAIGDRGTWLATIEHVFHYPGFQGETATGVVFFLDDGNRALWFASGAKELQRGKRVAITGTIKKHEPDKRSGIPTTILTRVAIEEPEAAAAKLGKVKGKKLPGTAKPGSAAAMKEQVKTVLKSGYHGWYHPLQAWAQENWISLPWRWTSEQGVKKLKKDELAHWLQVVGMAQSETPLPPPYMQGMGPNVLREPLRPAIHRVQVHGVDGVPHWVDVDHAGGLSAVDGVPYTRTPLGVAWVPPHLPPGVDPFTPPLPPYTKTVSTLDGVLSWVNMDPARGIRVDEAHAWDRLGPAGSPVTLHDLERGARAVRGWESEVES